MEDHPYEIPYKIGDILICKKDLIHPYRGVILIKNKKYMIQLTGFSSKHPTNPAIQLDSRIPKYSPFIPLFFLNPNGLKNNDYYFNDYFYTLKEQRKLKLEKIYYKK